MIQGDLVEAEFSTIDKKPWPRGLRWLDTKFYLYRTQRFTFTMFIRPEEFDKMVDEYYEAALRMPGNQSIFVTVKMRYANSAGGERQRGVVKPIIHPKKLIPVS